MEENGSREMLEMCHQTAQVFEDQSQHSLRVGTDSIRVT